MHWPLLERPYRKQAVGSYTAMLKYFVQGSGSTLFGTAASAAWPAANRAIYLPFEIEQVMLVTELWVFNGTAAVTGNWDIGIFSADGTKLVSAGSTAQSGQNALQSFNVTDTLIGRGAFWLALAASSGSTSVYRFAGGAANDWLMWGGLQEASALPLPATATFAGNTTQFLPLCGISAKLT